MPPSLLGEVPVWPNYPVGAVAVRDVYSPVRFELLDPDVTERRQNLAARKVPLLIRFNLDADLDSQGMLRATLRQKRVEFLDAVEAVYDKRTLSGEEASRSKFRKVLSEFRKQHKSFPLTRDLAMAWGQGRSDDTWMLSWSGQLKEGMALPIRPEPLPKSWYRSPKEVRIFQLSHGATNPSLKKAVGMSTRLHKTNMVALPRARRDFRARFPSNEKKLGRFLSLFLTNNCQFASKLTNQARSQRRAKIRVVDQYRPGQLLVRKGQYVDEKIWRALGELKLRLGRGDWISHPEPVLMVDSSEPAPQVVTVTKPDHRWRIAGGCLTALGLMALWMGVRRRRYRNVIGLPAPRTAGGLSASQGACPSCNSSLIVSSDGRISLPARQDPVRASVVAQMTRWLKGRFVRALLGERVEMHRQQDHAEQEIRTLSERLAKAHAPLQERLRTYEARITELERELERKGEVNRELIQAQIEAARKQMVIEKGSDTSFWN